MAEKNPLNQEDNHVPQPILDASPIDMETELSVAGEGGPK